MLLILIVNNAFGQDSISHTIQHLPLLSIQNIVLKTGNPTALISSPIRSFGNAEAGINHTKGNFKPVFLGKEQLDYNVEASKYFTLDNAIIKGQFTYSKGTHKDVYYTNIDNAYRLTPYLFVDTLDQGNVTAERYNLQIEWATKVSNKISFGTLIDYKVSLSAQDRDPRAENKVGQIKIKPGAIINLNKLKLGYDIFYQYYNEDINIITINKNTTHTLYALSGLGTFSAHEASSFNRLYKQHKWGGSIQLIGHKNLFWLSAHKFIETVDDGRKEGIASWSAIKNDSELNGYHYQVNNIYRIKTNGGTHHIGASGKWTQTIGTEILQKFEEHDNYNTSQWKTYNKEDKYKNEIYQINLSYQFAQLNKQERIKQILSFDSKYCNHSENYYIPNAHINYINLNTKVNYLKILYLGNNELSMEASVTYNKNLNRDISLAKNSVISSKIIIPNYQFYTANYWTSSVNLKYSAQPSFLQNTVYIKGEFSYLSASSGVFKGKTRTILNMGLGLMF